MRPIRSVAAVAVLILTSIIAGVSTPAVAGAGELHPAAAPPTGTFTLRNYNSPHYCLGVTGGEDNAPALQWQCNGAPDQTWHRGQEDGNTGYYQVINGEGECLGVYQISTDEGATVVGWQCIDHPDQYWSWDQSSESGYYYLTDYNSGQVVGVLDNSTAEGAAIVQWPNQHTPNNQLWAATPTNTTASAGTITQITQSAWAGYSAYPVNGYIDSASAIWTVPKVSCPLSIDDTPRAAIWVGMWGGTTSIHDKTAWLPQIGTMSACNTKVNGKLYYGASYWVIWELFTFVKGGGNAAQTGFRVSAGDEMSANVILEPPFTPGSVKRKFLLQIEDTNTRQTANITITTNKPVALGDVVRQGGGIAEGNGSPQCVLNVGSLCVITDDEGLADFSSTPAKFDYIGVDTNLIGGSGGFDYFIWVLKYAGQLLAVTEPIQFASYGNGSVFGFTVAWQRQT